MIPTSIDGTDITGATIDGQDVQEITVDGNTVFSSSSLTNNLVSYYNFEGNLNDTGAAGTVTDNGINSGVSFSTDSKVGTQSGDFSGTGDHFKISVSADNQFTGDFTIAYWFKYDASGRAITVNKRPFTATDGNSDVYFDLGEEIKIALFDKTVLFEDSSNLNDNNWHHIAISAKENVDATAYLDGSPFDTESIGSINFDSNDYLIGIKRTDAFENFNGLIDDLRFYDTALSDSEMQDLYNATDN